MKIVGLTGSIATGKSTVAEMLEELGASIIDADAIARAVVEPGQPGLKKIIEAFGEEVLLPDGSLDRDKLGEIIFNDEDKRKQLNNITHPMISERMMKLVAEERKKGAKVCVMDIPLLFEGGGKYSWLKPVLLAHSDEKAQLERLMERNSYSMEEAKSRISSQMNIDEKVKLADFVIYNSGTIEETREQVKAVWGKILTDD